MQERLILTRLILAYETKKIVKGLTDYLIPRDIVYIPRDIVYELALDLDNSQKLGALS